VIKVQSQPQITADIARTVFVVDDLTGKIKKADASLDGTAWISVFPDDGIAEVDTKFSPKNFGALTAGEHTISLRVFDTSGNVGTLSVTIRK
jgi:hypothetical protein